MTTMQITFTNNDYKSGKIEIEIGSMDEFDSISNKWLSKLENGEIKDFNTAILNRKEGR